MWIEHVTTSKKCAAPISWSSSASFDLNDLLTLGPSILKASNKLRSNPRSLTTRKNGQLEHQLYNDQQTRYHNIMLQFCVQFLSEKTGVSIILLSHLGSHSFVEFKGVLSFLCISNQFVFNKRSETKLDNIFGFCFFLRIFRSNLQVLEHFFESVTITIRWRERVIFNSHVWSLQDFCLQNLSFVVGLEDPVKEPGLVLNVHCDLICFSFLRWIAVLECWLTSEIPTFLMRNDVEQRVHLPECIQILSLLIHAYFSLQLATNFVSLLLISINYILKDMESLVKKLKRTV